MQCIFASDLHGNIGRYQRLFTIISQEKPDAVFLGGDLLPTHIAIQTTIEEFIAKNLFSYIQKIRKKINKNIRFFVILGNDDPRIYEPFFEDAEKNKLIDYVHNKTVAFEGIYVTGYSYVPPTPFLLKDWERYDVSRYVDVGAVSPEKGTRTVEVSHDLIKYATIAEDVENLSKKSPMEQTIFLFHAPPYDSFLDRAGLDGAMVDHAPVDVHIGSIAIQRFINTKQPLVTLHGHVHESAQLTGHWKEKFGKTYSFSAAHNGPELALVRFDTDALQNATRELIPLS